MQLLGENLAIGRTRRRESQRVWAGRLGVGMGIYATALWLLGRTQALAELADPQYDYGALELDVREAKRRRLARIRTHE